jgi:hypothetical protein
VKRRLSEVYAVKHTGEGDLDTAKLALKRANAIRERVRNLLKEQGWEDAETTG